MKVPGAKTLKSLGIGQAPLNARCGGSEGQGPSCLGTQRVGGSQKWLRSHLGGGHPRQRAQQEQRLASLDERSRETQETRGHNLREGPPA